jgi:hypothetical protein
MTSDSYQAKVATCQHADIKRSGITAAIAAPQSLPSATWRLGDDPKAGLGSERLREDALLACCCAICCEGDAAEAVSVSEAAAHCLRHVLQRSAMSSQTSCC